MARRKYRCAIRYAIDDTILGLACTADGRMCLYFGGNVGISMQLGVGQAWLKPPLSAFEAMHLLRHLHLHCAASLFISEIPGLLFR
jgi:hypothetical protein